MMNIDLKWGLPFVMPFVLLGTVRLLWFTAGAGWADPGLAALMSLLFGAFSGFVSASILSDHNIKWTVRLGPERTPHD